MSPERNPEVAAYWRRFCEQEGIAADQRYDVYAFGGSPEMADKLSDLVVNGPKRATAGLLADLNPPDDPLPAVGVYSVILDGRDQPACVVRTTQVEIKALREVDAAFAWDEGEGDRSRDWWLAAHRAFFERDRTRRGLTFNDDMPTVFERFDLIWTSPPQHVTRGGPEDARVGEVRLAGTPQVSAPLHLHHTHHLRPHIRAALAPRPTAPRRGRPAGRPPHSASGAGSAHQAPRKSVGTHNGVRLFVR